MSVVIQNCFLYFFKWTLNIPYSRSSNIYLGEFSQLHFVGKAVFLIEHFNQEVVAIHTDGTELAWNHVLHLLAMQLQNQSMQAYSCNCPIALQSALLSLQCYQYLSQPVTEAGGTSALRPAQALLVVSLDSTLKNVIGLGWFLQFWPRSH